MWCISFAGAHMNCGDMFTNLYNIIKLEMICLLLCEEQSTFKFLTLECCVAASIRSSITFYNN